MEISVFTILFSLGLAWSGYVGYTFGYGKRSIKTMCAASTCNLYIQTILLQFDNMAIWVAVFVAFCAIGDLEDKIAKLKK